MSSRHTQHRYPYDGFIFATESQGALSEVRITLWLSRDVLSTERARERSRSMRSEDDLLWKVAVVVSRPGWRERYLV